MRIEGERAHVVDTIAAARPRRLRSDVPAVEAARRRIRFRAEEGALGHRHDHEGSRRQPVRGGFEVTAPLTAARRSELRAQAHKLTPVVIIGDKGLTDEVVAEIDRSLKAHELIKVRAATDDREARGEWLERICERLEAHAVQQIGKVLVIYRENFDKPREKKPAAVPSPRVAARGDDAKRTSRPRSRTPSPRPASAPRRRRPRSSR